MTCCEALQSHGALSARRAASEAQLQKVRKGFESAWTFGDKPVSVFCAGSLARLETGRNSDLDLFVTANETPELRSRLLEYTLFAELIGVNRTLGLPPFSNDGAYLKVYFVEDLRDKTGSPRDDSENLFTARMLLMLESVAIVNDPLHHDHLQKIVEHYYRDQKGKHSFRPLFLLNDILRYWRTLCLNYEERRHDSSRPWRKKNVNLKFARMMTVFGTVLPLVLRPLDTVESFLDLCQRPPLERLAGAVDALGDATLSQQWPAILDTYESFLSWKEDDSIEARLHDIKAMVREDAERVSCFLYAALTHDRIPSEFRRYLIL